MRTWLENHWIAPAYSGAVIVGITLCFFAAATNTMAGWLYAICGTSMALLIVSAILPGRSLRPLQVRRLPIDPVSAGEDLAVTLEVVNPSDVGKNLLEIHDILPFVLDKPHSSPIEFIPPRNSHQWTHYIPTSKRGIYHWHEVTLRTAAPLGLFWSSRQHEVSARAVVYPQVLTLSKCPIVDSLGQDQNQRLQSDRRHRKATEGFTRNLRQYRYGDSTRLIHWKTSARLGEFQVRELEILSGGQEVVIALDTQGNWREETFDRAITAAASLYFYATRAQLTTKLWTATTGPIRGERTILETLAAVESSETQATATLPSVPIIWLTANPGSLDQLPAGSRWLLFTKSEEAPAFQAGVSLTEPDVSAPPRLFTKSEEAPAFQAGVSLTRQLIGLSIDADRPLQQQLQTSPR
jgi:uncharacterized protein (DUF58 family)